ncbi:hypothetical protein EW146_g7748 [Bondarzewia mesenterica]|uniref:Methyltransferase domain-containing protein n=1 Tax=Bondarzewia mesenterica TaxID=1095465 RepID=A0A4S4LQB6_9AGAM|nr:hypothetical protein EW146_g7748 [Bondarzewia mesenterica]
MVETPDSAGGRIYGIVPLSTTPTTTFSKHHLVNLPTLPSHSLSSSRTTSLPRRGGGVPVMKHTPIVKDVEQPLDNDDEQLLVKDVEYTLMNEQKRIRRPFNYPLNSSKDLVDFGIWDVIFLTSLIGGLTMHQFETPPSMVLDLGCGCGFWAIEVARKYPECTVIGLDLTDDQPDLSHLHDMSGIGGRVKWAHGNFLEALNFPDNTFDLVRIAFSALGVPEYEWQYLLEEILRVLKPGGIFELIEDDLIFPVGRLFEPPTPPLSALSFETSTQRSPSRSRSSLPTEGTQLSSVKTQYSSEHMVKSKSDSQESYHLPSPHPWGSEIDMDPLDHSKLQAAWQEMLSSRWLTPQLTSVIPLYLSSMFEEYRAIPALEVFMPSSDIPLLAGHNTLHFSDDGSVFEQKVDIAPYRHLRHAIVKDDPETSSIRSGNTSSEYLSVSAPMHLARSVQVVKGCKEAIWEAYEKLYGNEPVVHRVKERPNKNTARDQFEYAWMNWENDMADRIGMRDFVESSLGWPSPKGDPPDWRVWRDCISKDPENIRYNLPPSSHRPDFCRCVRGFVAWKQGIPQPPPIPEKSEHHAGPRV